MFVKKYAVIFIVLFLVIVCAAYIIKNENNTKLQTDSARTVKYIPIGDSFTIGMGVEEKQRWPNILIDNLRNEGLNIELVTNPAISGHTVRDAIDQQIPVIKKIKPDFVTVFIGTNDNFAQKNPEDFRADLVELLDILQTEINVSDNIVVVTIPDYTKSPAMDGENNIALSESIEAYNRIIKFESEKRGYAIADIFPLSQTMTDKQGYIEDGLHPSHTGYLKWEQIIFPVVLELLSD